MEITGTPAESVFQSLHLLALLGMRESGADGYTLHVLDPGSRLSLERCSAGWAVPETGRDGVRVVSFPLRENGVETARLAFGFLSPEVPPHSQIVLGRIIEAMEAVWDYAQRAEEYFHIAGRIAVLEVELASWKINDRARGLLDKRLNESDAIDTLVRHIETVLRPRPSSELLDKLLQTLEEERAARELTAQAKVFLQNAHGMSEEEAHRHLRVASRRSRRTVTEVARELIDAGR